ncbi:hypothetical protein EK0264_11575 [Epidermidibacterium keratini]|uniref:Tox-REase-5 domain-containing protein n=1 Tax=Epidermidibacterium keratini TaxID=1891644 RepID=A0A7L4YPY3_9ACTN|nr:hypothetical protein [Epidermidibacterium keratini]QHC00859.1 hypothetical protein EK0264_11575 [Epidermidibacterium keratini]
MTQTPGNQQPRELNAEEYNEFITGLPDGITYQVQDPVTKLMYDFDGFANGHLIWTIANFDKQFDAVVGPLPGGIEQAYIESARLQDAVRQGYPIMWCVQKPQDVERLRAVLADGGVTSIVVQHEAPE